MHINDWAGAYIGRMFTSPRNQVGKVIGWKLAEKKKGIWLTLLTSGGTEFRKYVKFDSRKITGTG